MTSEQAHDAPGPSPSVDLYLIVGWLCMVVVPVLGFFIGWYCFRVAYTNSGMMVARVSLLIAQALSILIVLAFLFGLFLGLLLPLLARASGTG